MRTTVGLFTSMAKARIAADELRRAGFADDRLNLLSPGTSLRELEAVAPTAETEQPGMGTAVGGIVGGATGAATGFVIAGTAMVPGVGPVVAAGLLAGAILGIGGAAIGGALEESLGGGVPKDELFLYEDALRQGRTVLIVVADDEDQTDTARRILLETGAESLDAARERWWVGLRSAEAEHYTTQGGDFQRDEARYRRGFEAALDPKTQGRPYDDVVEYLRTRYPEAYSDAAFRRGYERGRAYRRGLDAAA
ncbi:MAG TPA: hypothetical protein VGW35_17080 [Methylomirabilota bacterium]|jgi:hypothetical protein|nr:hypothetical protein [Methylomirabilota bacterium]